jgi:RHS repeat-associated protein
MSDRSYNSTAIRYTFNGKEDEIFAEWQDYGFRNYDKRQRRFTSVDPLTAKYPWYTPYQFAGNTVLVAIDLDGQEPEFSIGANIFLTNKGLMLNSYASVSYKTKFAMAAVTYGVNLNVGELGTSHNQDAIFFSTFSPSLTLGFGKSDAIPLTTFPSIVGTGVKNSFKYSFTAGQNFIESSGKTSDGSSADQRTGYLGFRVGQFYAGSANDTKKNFGDGGDTFWSANVQAGYNLGKGARLALNLDMYYGKSNEKAVYDNDKKTFDLRKRSPKYQNYDNQNNFDKSFNDATSTLQLTLPFQNQELNFGIGIKGRSAMFPSNAMHNTINIENKDGKIYKFHHLYVPNNTKPYFRFGVNTSSTTKK